MVLQDVVYLQFFDRVQKSSATTRPASQKKKSDRSGRIMLFVVVVVDVSQCTNYLQATLIS